MNSPTVFSNESVDMTQNALDTNNHQNTKKVPVSFKTAVAELEKIKKEKEKKMNNATINSVVLSILSDSDEDKFHFATTSYFGPTTQNIPDVVTKIILYNPKKIITPENNTLRVSTYVDLCEVEFGLAVAWDNGYSQLDLGGKWISGRLARYLDAKLTKMGLNVYCMGYFFENDGLNRLQKMPRNIFDPFYIYQSPTKYLTESCDEFNTLKINNDVSSVKIKVNNCKVVALTQTALNAYRKYIDTNKGYVELRLCGYDCSRRRVCKLQLEIVRDMSIN